MDCRPVALVALSSLNLVGVTGATDPTMSAHKAHFGKSRGSRFIRRAECRQRVVGPWDRLVREGQSALGQALPLTLGSYISGTVAALGADVGVFALGDAVYGATNDL